MNAVAVLYIDPRGPYPRMAEVRGLTNSMIGGPFTTSLDCYDAGRDARLYDGPHPVVAHPPCRNWSRLRHLAKVSCGACAWTGRQPWFNGHCINGEGDEQCDGAVVSDADCAPRAVEQVRKFGGVLEHPAGSKLWEALDLPPPYETPEAGLPEHSPLWRKHNKWPLWKDGRAFDGWGYTIEVDQVEWGHVARKTTWLYLVGVPRSALEKPPFPGREPTHWVSGGRGRTGKKAKTTPVPPGIKVCSEQQRRRTPPPLRRVPDSTRALRSRERSLI